MCVLLGIPPSWASLSAVTDVHELIALHSRVCLGYWGDPPHVCIVKRECYCRETNRVFSSAREPA